jgi:hypothetical protein
MTRAKLCYALKLPLRLLNLGKTLIARRIMTLFALSAIDNTGGSSALLTPPVKIAALTPTGRRAEVGG